MTIGLVLLLSTSAVYIVSCIYAVPHAEVRVINASAYRPLSAYRRHYSHYRSWPIGRLPLTVTPVRHQEAA